VFLQAPDRCAHLARELRIDPVADVPALDPAEHGHRVLDAFVVGQDLDVAARAIGERIGNDEVRVPPERGQPRPFRMRHRAAYACPAG
jgi:hypothetical protein